MSRKKRRNLLCQWQRGKTYLWKTIITKRRSDGKIVLAVALSRIASLLLPGGHTAHSQFKISLQPHETSCCSISKQSNLADFIRNTTLIIWDEAPMMHKHAFDAVNRTLRDILNMSNPAASTKLFGEITVAFMMILDNFFL